MMSFLLRRDRYHATDETVEVARAAYAAAQEAEPSPFWWAVFDLGFVLLWHGDLDEATAVLRESLTEAERRGDVTTRSRALTYLMVAGRKRGDVEGVRKAIGPVIEGAREASLPEYEAMAIANRAWVAWRSGDQETAAADAQAALRMWEGLPVRYFFDWMALWPLARYRLGLPAHRTSSRVRPRNAPSPAAATPGTSPDPGPRRRTRMGRRPAGRNRRIAPPRGARSGRPGIPVRHGRDLPAAVSGRERPGLCATKQSFRSTMTVRPPPRRACRTAVTRALGGDRR